MTGFQARMNRSAGENAANSVNAHTNASIRSGEEE
jgi:hypothetical protein